MDKFFDIIKKLRPGVQSGKVSREQALAELMQESGVSEDIAGSAVTKMMPSSGGITTLPEAEVLDVSFKPGVDKRGKRVEESPSQASGAKEKTSWKDYVEEETPSQGSGFANIDPDILSLGQKDRFEYEMAKYKQERSRKMQPIYKKYGAQSEKDKELIDELYEYNIEGDFVPSKGNPKYINNSARTFMQESVEDIPGVDEDLVLDILYSKESERFLKNQGVDNYINYVQTRFKEIGLNFNKPLLKRFLKDRYGPEEFSVGGRVGFKDGNKMPVVTIDDKIDELISFYQDYLKKGGKMDFMTFAKKYIPENFATGGRAGFKDGVGRKGILSALKDKLNEIAPGSTAVGKTTKAVSDKAKRAAAERELTEGFNRFNKKFPSEEVRPSNEKIIEREKIDVDIGTIEDFYNDFVKAGGDPSVTLKDLQQGYNLKKAYPFNTPYIDKKGKLIGQEATQEMYPKSKKFYIEDPDVLGQRITDMREGRMPKTAEGERTGVDVPAMPEGFSTSKEILLKQFPEIDENFAETMMQMDKDLLGRTIMMLKDRRKNPELYDKLLEKYGDTLEFQAEFDKATRRKLNAEGGLNYLMGL
jgi:hypothetical protein